MTRSRPLRVLHVISAILSENGGPMRALLSMCHAVTDADPSVALDIATTDARLDAAWLAQVRAALPASVGLHVFPHSPALDPGASVALARWLWRNAGRYDVIHTHALFSSTVSGAAWAARLRGVPYIMRPLGTLSPYTFANRKRLLKRMYFGLVDRPVLRHAAALHFTTANERLKADRLRLPTPRTVLPPPVDAHTWDAARPARPVRRILFLGRLHPVKGLDRLLPAFQSASVTHPALRLVVAGAGDAAYESALRADVARLGLAERVEFVGFVDGERKLALLRDADALVMPSYQENFGIAVAEAMAAGLPVVVTRGVDLWPDVEEWGAGVVVDGDAPSLAAALCSLADAPEAARRMGENAARLVAERYSPDAVGRGLVALYEQCARRGRAPALRG